MSMDTQRKLESLRISGENLSGAVHKALDHDLKIEKRKTMFLCIGVIFMLCYLTWMYGMIKQINPQVIVGAVEQNLVTAMPKVTKKITDYLHGKIPELKNQLRDFANARFEEVSKQAETQGRAKFTDVQDELRGQLRDGTAEFLNDIKAHIDEHYPNLTPAERNREFLNEFSHQYRKFVVGYFEDKKNPDNKNALNEELDDVIAFVRHLATTADVSQLTKRQQLERKFIESVVALVHQSVQQGNEETDEATAESVRNNLTPRKHK